MTTTSPTEIRVGDRLPAFVRVTGLENWNRFAAVNDEFVSIHMDDEAGRAAGYPTAFGMGNLQWSYLHALLREWIGEQGWIVSLACQFRAANTKGQTVTATGEVVAVRSAGDRVLVDLEIRTAAEDGSVLAPGTATVSLPG